MMIIGLLGPFFHNNDTLLAGIMLTAFYFLFGLFCAVGFANNFFTGRRFDSQFKNVLVTDKNIDSKLYSTFLSV